MPSTLPPSIFNDVVGPVMRGPSSSHSAASVRIGRLARDLCGGQPESVLVEFDTEGSLPTTHDSQGSDMGLFGGLLGWDADDERLPESAAALKAAGIQLEIRIATFHDPHPNTYRLTVHQGWRRAPDGCAVDRWRDDRSGVDRRLAGDACTVTTW